MKRRYEVSWTERVARRMTVNIYAKSQQEAIELVREGSGYIKEDEQVKDETIMDCYAWRAEREDD